MVAGYHFFVHCVLSIGGERVVGDGLWVCIISIVVSGSRGGYWVCLMDINFKNIFNKTISCL